MIGEWEQRPLKVQKHRKNLEETGDETAPAYRHRTEGGDKHRKKNNIYKSLQGKKKMSPPLIAGKKSRCGRISTLLTVESGRGRSGGVPLKRGRGKETEGSGGGILEEGGNSTAAQRRGEITV